MVSFKHIIITRFNLPKRWNKDKLGNVILDKTWLDDRYDLFESFCFPSIINQTNQNFEWWVYFDKNMDIVYKRRNERLNEKFSKFIPKYESSYDDFEVNMPREISNNLIQENKNWIITTRLDNDDMLAIDTIKIIQNKIDFKEAKLLEIPFGFTLEIGRFSNLKKVESYLNPFISLVEKKNNNQDIKSVYYYQHNQWKGIDKVTVSQNVQWIQIIHDTNISNRALGKEVYPLRLNKRFKFNKANMKFQYFHVFAARKMSYLLKKTINKVFKLFDLKL